MSLGSLTQQGITASLVLRLQQKHALLCMVHCLPSAIDQGSFEPWRTPPQLSSDPAVGQTCAECRKKSHAMHVRVKMCSH